MGVEAVKRFNIYVDDILSFIIFTHILSVHVTSGDSV